MFSRHLLHDTGVGSNNFTLAHQVKTIAAYRASRNYSILRGDYWRVKQEAEIRNDLKEQGGSHDRLAGVALNELLRLHD